MAAIVIATWKLKRGHHQEVVRGLLFYLAIGLIISAPKVGRNFPFLLCTSSNRGSGWRGIPDVIRPPNLRIPRPLPSVVDCVEKKLFCFDILTGTQGFSRDPFVLLCLCRMPTDLRNEWKNLRIFFTRLGAFRSEFRRMNRIAWLINRFLTTSLADHRRNRFNLLSEWGASPTISGENTQQTNQRIRLQTDGSDLSNLLLIAIPQRHVCAHHAKCSAFHLRLVPLLRWFVPGISVRSISSDGRQQHDPL